MPLGYPARPEKTIVLRAPRSKVWRALTNSDEFGEWFGTRLAEPFSPGRKVRGPITMPKYAHLSFEVTVEQMEPERLFSWSWQPGGDPDSDPSGPTTLVVFELEEVPEGTRLTVRESGFDRLPVGWVAGSRCRSPGSPLDRGSRGRVSPSISGY